MFTVKKLTIKVILTVTFNFYPSGNTFFTNIAVFNLRRTIFTHAQMCARKDDGGPGVSFADCAKEKLHLFYQDCGRFTILDKWRLVINWNRNKLSTEALEKDILEQTITVKFTVQSKNFEHTTAREIRMNPFKSLIFSMTLHGNLWLCTTTYSYGSDRDQRWMLGHDKSTK